MSFHAASDNQKLIHRRRRVSATVTTAKRAPHRHTVQIGSCLDPGSGLFPARSRRTSSRVAAFVSSAVPVAVPCGQKMKNFHNWSSSRQASWTAGSQDILPVASLSLPESLVGSTRSKVRNNLRKHSRCNVVVNYRPHEGCTLYSAWRSQLCLHS